MSSHIRPSDRANIHPVDRAPRGPKLSDLPTEVFQLITDHITRADLTRLAAVDRATRLSIMDIPHESLRPPSGFQLPTTAPSKRTYGANVVRREYARFNMARGLGHLSAFAVPTGSAFRYPSKQATAQLGTNPFAPVIETQSCCLLTAEAVTPAGVEIRSPANGHNAHVEVSWLSSLKDYIALTADRSCHGAIIYNPAIAPRPTVWRFERGQEPKSFQFFYPSNNRLDRLWATTACSLGSDGTTASTKASDGHSTDFWRLEDNVFELAHTIEHPSDLLFSCRFAGCPATGRIAKIDSNLTLTLQAPQSGTEVQTTLDAAHEGRNVLKFSPDGRGLLVKTFQGDKLKHVSLYATLMTADGIQTITRRSSYACSSTHDLKAYWHLDRSGSWLLALEDLGTSPATKQPTRLFRINGETIAYAPLSSAQQALRASYAKACKSNKFISVQGRDEEGNNYHLLAPSAHSSTWLYRIATETGHVSCISFDKLLALQIQFEAEPGSVQWSIDSTAVQFLQRRDQTLRYIDFGQEAAKVKLKFSYLRAIFNTSIYAYVWAEFRKEAVHLYNNHRKEFIITTGAILGLCGGIVAASPLSGLMLAATRTTNTIHAVTAALGVVTGLVVGLSLAIVSFGLTGSEISSLLSDFYHASIHLLKKKMPEATEHYSLDSLIARGLPSVPHRAGSATS